MRVENTVVINFSWVIKAHPRRKNIAIVILPDGRVEVRVPLHFSSANAERFLIDNLDWVNRQLNRLPQKSQSAEASIDWFGETFELIINQDAPFEINLDRKEIRSPNKKVLALARRKELVNIINDRLIHWLKLINHWPEQPNRIRVRAMTTRWGSCSSKRNINLSLMLAEQPIELIDYVIVHELCHLKEMNHSERFWTLVSSIMPDWKRRRALLNRRDSN